MSHAPSTHRARAATGAALRTSLPEGTIPVALAHPHALRHGFALRYLTGRKPGTLSRLQQLLGHEDIATTARYLAAVDQQRAPAPRDPWAR